MTLVEFAEKLSPVPLMDWQKQFLAAYEQAEKEGKRLVFIPPRTSSRRILIQIIEEFENGQDNHAKRGRENDKINSDVT